MDRAGVARQTGRVGGGDAGEAAESMVVAGWVVEMSERRVAADVGGAHGVNAGMVEMRMKHLRDVILMIRLVHWVEWGWKGMQRSVASASIIAERACGDTPGGIGTTVGIRSRCMRWG